VHAFGGAPAISNASYWPGHDIARGLTLTTNASKANAAGWSLDAYGGVHPFGSAPAVFRFVVLAGLGHRARRGGVERQQQRRRLGT